MLGSCWHKNVNVPLLYYNFRCGKQNKLFKFSLGIINYRGRKVKKLLKDMIWLLSKWSSRRFDNLVTSTGNLCNWFWYKLSDWSFDSLLISAGRLINSFWLRFKKVRLIRFPISAGKDLIKLDSTFKNSRLVSWHSSEEISPIWLFLNLD